MQKKILVKFNDVLNYCSILMSLYYASCSGKYFSLSSAVARFSVNIIIPTEISTNVNFSENHKIIIQN